MQSASIDHRCNRKQSCSESSKGGCKHSFMLWFFSWTSVQSEVVSSGKSLKPKKKPILDPVFRGLI